MLAWGRPWWNENATSSSPHSSCLLRTAYKFINASSQWREKGGGEERWLEPEVTGKVTFPFDKYVTSAYWTVIGRQFTVLGQFDAS
jgi:hypothetical protein